MILRQLKIKFRPNLPFSSRKVKGSTLFLLYLFLCIFTYINYFKDEKEVFEGFQDSEIAEILRVTPHLWRKFDIHEKNESSRSKIQAQQDWIKRLSKTRYIFKAKPKVIWMEDDISLYYWTDGKVHCPYAPSFENKCEVRSIPPEIKLMVAPHRYKNMKGDAIISVRNWDPISKIYHIPKNMLHIIHILEPPHIAMNASLGKTNALLASYWSGSDIPTPYYLYVPNTKNNTATFPTNSDVLRAKIKSKTKLATAMISSCVTRDRLDYIAELQKFVEVDVYGKCGSLTCPKGQPCFKMFETKYKFYLAFENSRCEDYITEKLFQNALGHYMVPIVRGPRKATYLSAAPPNSFIHVDDFQSPQKLGEYLSYLNSNDEAYLKYFEWKGSGSISSGHFHDMFCRVCAMLFYADWIPPPSWSSAEIEWKDVNICLSKNASRWPD